MSTVRRALKPQSALYNFMYNMAYKGSSLLFLGALTLYAPRVLGAALVGRVEYVNSFAYYFFILASMGVPTLGVKLLAARGADRRATTVNLFALQLCCSLLAVALYALLYAVLLRRDDADALFLLQLAHIASYSFNVLWVYQGEGKFSTTAKVAMLARLALFAALFALVRGPDDVFMYAVVLAFNTSLEFMLLCVPLARRVRASDLRLISGRMLRSLLPMAIPLMLTHMSSVLLMNMDKTMLGKLSTYTEAGYYTFSFRILNAVTMLISSIEAVLLQASARGEGAPEARHPQALRGVCLVLLTGSVGFSALVSLNADWVVRLLYGPQNIDAWANLAALVWVVPFTTLTSALAFQHMIPRGMERRYMLCMLAGAGFNFVLNSVFIPRLGATGAAIASVASYVGLYALMHARVRRDVGMLYTARALAGVALVWLAVSAVSLGVRMTTNAPPAIVLANGALYMIGLALTIPQVRNRLSRRAG